MEIRGTDFLTGSDREQYDFIVGNPPYVSILGLDESEKTRYREKYETAVGRFDLYLLFFEEALRRLKPGGRLVFITPEKFLYVETAEPLRKLLAGKTVEELRLIDEQTFGEFVTYPAITTVRNSRPTDSTRVLLRDGRDLQVSLQGGGSSWLPRILGGDSAAPALTLEDVCIRVSCGVATGADGVFVRRDGEIDRALERFAYPTISGRDLPPTNGVPRSKHVMLIPYEPDGELLEEEQLGRLGKYLRQPRLRAALEKRTCAARKPWYAFHENPPLEHILRPKILCKDITETPHFWIDRKGGLVPRHSVYYIVPKDPPIIDSLAEYLNSQAASEWLRANCQRAVNGFLRLQSHVLKRLPLPLDLAGAGASAEQHKSSTSRSARSARRRDTATAELGLA